MRPFRAATLHRGTDVTSHRCRFVTIELCGRLQYKWRAQAVLNRSAGIEVMWGGVPESAIIAAVKRAFWPAVALQDPEKQRVNRGMHLCIHGGLDVHDHTTFQIGPIPDRARHALTLALCVEKAQRLFGHTDHVLSWQSRDPDKKRYGGAVKVFVGGRPITLAVSGLSPADLADEAVALSAMRDLGWLTPAQCASYAILSGNTYYIPG